MSKYINADKAKNGVMEFVDEYGEIVGMFVNDFNILLERCSVDVQEVRHGRWIDIEPAPHNLFYATCSVCGERQTIEVANFCPMCGASLVKGEE